MSGGEAGPSLVAVDDPAALGWAAELLLRGEAVALPTDTVYGLAVRAADANAQRRLFEFKRRPRQFSIAVLVSDLAAAEMLVRLTPSARLVAQRFWPGPLTLVAELRPDAPRHLGDGATLGVRVADEPLVRRLAAPPSSAGAGAGAGAAVSSVGPLAVTSANIHGEATATTAKELAEQFPELELVIDGGTRDGPASTVADVTGTDPVILRQGAVALDALG